MSSYSRRSHNQDTISLAQNRIKMGQQHLSLPEDSHYLEVVVGHIEVAFLDRLASQRGARRQNGHRQLLLMRQVKRNA